ncbi:MAG: hypothetical protein Q4P84_02615 [Elusimicrobiales bacterium]|nr:hypothetical protein [Elusimicrobiales bacterium]
MKKKRNEVIAAYGERKDFLTAFNPDTQQLYCKHEDLCFFADVPSLALCNTVYGPNTAAMFLVVQLNDLSEYAGVKNKLVDKALEQCACAIANKYYYLKVSEILLFFKRFKEGRYGIFYGSVDPLVIMSSIPKFLQERATKLDERRRLYNNSGEVAGAITFEEYCRSKGERAEDSVLYRLLHPKTDKNKEDERKRNTEQKNEVKRNLT